MRARYRMAGPVLLATLVAGCGLLGMPRFEQPTIALQAISVQSLGLTGGSVDLLLDVTNPNRFDLRGTRLDLALEVEGTHFGDVVLNDAFNLPQGEVTRVVVPLTFTWAGVGAAAGTALRQGSLAYELKGTASLQTPFGLEKVPFTREGVVRTQ